VPVTVIVDESQTMAAVDYGSIMAEAQKYGGSILLSTQGLSLLEPSMQRENLARVALDRQLLANTDTLVVFRVAGDDASRISIREFNEEVPPATLTNLPQFTAYVRTVVGREVVPPFAVETREMPKEDSSIRARVLTARSTYSLTLEEAAEGADRAMNVILRHFGTEVASATAIHDGAFGNVLGGELSFPDLEGPGETGGSVLSGESQPAERSSQDQLDGQVGTREMPSSSQDLAKGARTPHDRMLDMLDRVEGWFEEERGDKSE
jgi:hypothetical protein